jgi:hypothetical protein
MSAAGSNPINTDFVFHYRRITLVVAPNKANIANAFQSGPLAAIAAALNNTWTAQFVRVRFPNDPLDMFLDTADASTGTISGDRMSSEDSAYLSFTTSKRGKSYRGGKHIAPMSESDTTSGSEDIFNAACLTRLAAINTAFLAGLTDSDGNQWVAAVLSRKLSNFAVTPCVLELNDIVSAKVNKRIGSMLRRKVKSVY